MNKSIIFIFLFIALFPKSITVFSSQLNGSISINSKVPQNLFGTWKVISTQIYSSNPSLFIPLSVDYWTLYKKNDIIFLENPNTNAIASINIQSILGNTITFHKYGENDSEKYTETPTLILNNNTFSGTDKIIIKRYEHNKYLSTDIIEFKINGTKISDN